MNIEHDKAAAKVLGVPYEEVAIRQNFGGEVFFSVGITGDSPTLSDPATRDAVVQALHRHGVMICITRSRSVWYAIKDSNILVDGLNTYQEALGAACVEVMK